MVFGVFRGGADHDASDLPLLSIAGEGDRGDAKVIGNVRLGEEGG
jgi:hypothetical protein